MLKDRNEVLPEDRWNVEAMYPDVAAWKKEFETIPLEKNPHWPEIAAYKGKLEKPEDLKALLDLIFSIDRKLTNLYTYARLRHDEDLTNDLHKVLDGQIATLVHDFQQEISWFEPELLALSNDTIKRLLAAPILSEYKFHLEKIVRVKPHVLSKDQEELLALAGKPLQATYKAFSAINDADFKFGSVLNSEGEERELTHGSYGMFIRDQDRTLRKNAFMQLHGVYLRYENTLSELIDGQVQSHFFNARARKYPTCLEASLFPKNIDTTVYHSLVKAVNEKIGALHDYVSLRQKLLGLDRLHLYDMYVPLTSKIDIRMPYIEAEDIVIESVSPLGAEYQNIMRKGFKEQRWVDRYENRNKRSGAYSSGCYDSMPYILMNYKGMLRDVFTLAHEAGHSMHSYLSHKNQPYHYGDYTIFLAEVASTFNEELLIQLLLKRASTKEEKIYLLNQKIEDIRTTLFRQVMFAEFELLIHEMAEKNIPITPRILKEEFRNLNKRYFGDQVVIDDEADIEWARIPHFYYNFYVYQYATGISAALALADRVTKGGKTEREDYLAFLKGGSSRYPIDMLKVAGIDMRSPEPVKAAIEKFSGLVKELQKLI